MSQFRRIPVILFALLIAAPLFAQQPVRQTDPSLLTLDTIFSYGAKSIGWHEWQANGSGYLMLEPSAASDKALDIVRYDAATGAFVISWTSQIVGGPFNGFSGYWHLQGHFTPAS